MSSRGGFSAGVVFLPALLRLRSCCSRKTFQTPPVCSNGTSSNMFLTFLALSTFLSCLDGSCGVVFTVLIIHGIRKQCIKIKKKKTN